MTRVIEVTAETHCPRGFRAPPHRLSWTETRTVLDELAGAPADTGALLLRYLLLEDGYTHLRVVTEHGGESDPGSWCPLDALIRLAEFPDPECDALADAFDAAEADESERRHQAAHAAGRL